MAAHGGGADRLGRHAVAGLVDERHAPHLGLLEHLVRDQGRPGREQPEEEQALVAIAHASFPLGP
ncbi:hypothetical protein [Nitrospira sp. Kam-Ns4a]